MPIEYHGYHALPFINSSPSLIVVESECSFFRLIIFISSLLLIHRRPCLSRYPRCFTIIITNCCPYVSRIYLLAVPAHIFPLTPEQLYRIPLSYPLSLTPAPRLFIRDQLQRSVILFGCLILYFLSQFFLLTIYIPPYSDIFSSAPSRCCLHTLPHPLYFSLPLFYSDSGNPDH